LGNTIPFSGAGGVEARTQSWYAFLRASARKTKTMGVHMTYNAINTWGEEERTWVR